MPDEFARNTDKLWLWLWLWLWLSLEHKY